jgi:hypothetical protein
VPTPDPTRERPYDGHQCGCLLGAHNRCCRIVKVPDQPICDGCLAERHPNEPEFSFVPPEVPHARA